MCLDQGKKKIKLTHYAFDDVYQIVKDSVLRGYLRIKCKQDKVILFDEFVELPDEIWSSATNAMKPLHLYFYNPYYIEDQDFLSNLLKLGKKGMTPAKDRTRFTGRAKPSGRKIISIQEKYPRVSPRVERIINPLHSKLVAEFAKWLKKEFNIIAEAEKEYMDLQFSHSGKTYMAEAKIIYGTSPRISIREALGQILEYNYYDPNSNKDRWIILLNEPPQPKDRMFVDALVKMWRFPLTLSWKDGKTFLFSDDTERELHSSNSP
jgi:hypothetical protein